MFFERLLFVLLLGAGAYALFGPKSPPRPKAEASAASAAATLSARPGTNVRAPGSARQPILASSALNPQALAEMQIVRNARMAVSQDRPDDALKELKIYEQKFPGGRLADDVTLLRIEANLKKGDRKTATQLGDALKAKSPESRQNMRAQRLLSEPPPPAQ